MSKMSQFSLEFCFHQLEPLYFVRFFLLKPWLESNFAQMFKCISQKKFNSNLKNKVAQWIFLVFNTFRRSKSI